MYALFRCIYTKKINESMHRMECRYNKKYLHARNLNSALQVFELKGHTCTDNLTSNSIICAFNILVWVCTNFRLYDTYCYEYTHSFIHK